MIARALDAGVHFLLARQHADGTWRDYHAMPIGAATEWVTAFVAAALAESAVVGAGAAIARAADALLAARPRARAWGFNASVDPDADSTAWAIRALRGAGAPVPAASIAFVRALQRPSGGFATYPRADAWGDAHPDVTPIAALACAPAAPEIVDAAVASCMATVDVDATWPAYWWRGRHYSTYWNRALLAAVGRPAPAFRAAAPNAPDRRDASRTIVSAFDLAWVLALAVLDGDPRAALDALAELLIARQGADGGWPGADDLRVTAPDCDRPWLRPSGMRFRDDVGLVTTASAVRALALALARSVSY